MGTTIMFYLAVRKPDWVENSISIYVALAPVTRLAHNSSPFIKALAPHLSIVKGIYEFFGVYELFSKAESEPSLKLICGHVPSLCEKTTTLIASSSTEMDDQ